MKTALRGASGAALIIGFAGSLQAAWAQQAPTTPAQPQTVTSSQTTQPQTAPAPQSPEQTRQQAREEPDRVVVTGSLTGNREAGELAIEVYTVDDFRKAGSPNITEFVQSLSIVGDSVGYTDPAQSMDGGVYTDLYGPGFMNFNLRGLGDADSERTLNLLNGRRTDPNANMIPTQALQQVEILKDGASATYGAGAVGGVVNFITRRDFEGVILEGEVKFIEAASDAPQYEMKYTQGWAGENSNLLLALGYSHQGSITAGSFSDWAFQPYEVNPRQWSTTTASTNPSVWYGNQTTSPSVPDFTTNVCQSLGGVNPRTSTAHPQAPTDMAFGSVCFLDNAPFLNVVQELKTYRAYLQYDASVSETMEFHAELSFTKTDAPDIRNPGSGTPSQAQSALESGGTNFPATQCSALAGRCGYTVSTAHPAFADFLARANVGRPVPLQTTNPVGAGYLGTPVWGGFWRPFAYGGLYEGEPYTRGYRREDNWRGALELSGTFSEDGFFGLGRLLPKDTTYKYSASGATRKGVVSSPDVVSFRLQEALNGFGGPNCQALDLVPTTATVLPARTDFPNTTAGTTAYNAAVQAAITNFNNSIGTQNDAARGKNGCQWFNPFASAFPANAATGAVNPAYNPALANDPEMVKWLFTDGRTQSRYQELNFDFLFAGDVPGIELPGGAMNWGVGGQWRQWEYENRGLDPYMTPRYWDCPWDPWTPAGQNRQVVGGIGCDRTGTSGPGAMMARSPRQPTNTDRQIIAGFGELHAPIFDNLSVSGTARYEEISGSIGGWVWNSSFKWDVLDWVAVRGSYSSNFASPSPDVIDNDGNVAVTQVGGTGGPTVPVTTIVDRDLEVETTEQFSVGFLFDKSDLFIEDSRFKASIDYFNYFIEGEVSTLSGSTIVSRLFPAVGTGTGAIVDTGQPRVTGGCSNPLFEYVTLSSPCVDAVITNRIVQNPGTATTVANVAAANTLVINGPGIKQAGVDFTIDYTFPFLGGELGLGTRGTRLLQYQSKSAFINGTPIPLSLAAGFGGGEYYMGNANVAQFFGTGKNGSRWRVSAYANYGIEDMNFRWTTRLISAVDDERGCFTYAGNGSTTGGGSTCFGVDGEDYYISDFNWTWDLPFDKDFQVRLSVMNVFDKDPPPLAGGEGISGVYFPSLPYNAYIASPLGRQFEIGFSKSF